ncbi:hypothetical protein MUP77_08240 [Candidatus Bathyarchaeota archaeon]|nr:hypothetical protein [Candidatus Bathyarchaeota archaeon]
MLSKLIKFVILTRFSKPLLALLTIIFVYNFFIYTFVSTNFSLFVVLQYYGPGIITFMLTLTTLSGGIVVLKSDRDYLFTLPLDKRELALSLYIAQFVASGLMIFYFFGFFSSAVAGMEYGRVLLVADLISLTLTVTSLSVVSNILPTRWRVLAGVLLAIWNLSAILGFAFAPASIFTGNVVNGSASIFALTAIVTVVAFRELEHVQLGMMRSLIRSTSSEVKNMRSFAGMSPVRAIFSENFSVLHFAGRMNMGGVSQYQTTSVPLTRMVLVTSVLAVVYGYVTMVFSPATTLGNPIASVFPTFVLFFSFLTSQGGIANERAWLALTAMEPRLYFRYVSIARILALGTIISPFAAANMALALLGIDVCLFLRFRF